MRRGWLRRIWQAGGALARSRSPSGPRSRSRWARGRRAIVAVEFALVGPPFLFCLVFMVELGYDLYAQEMLDYGLQTAARQIQLGKAQGAATPALFITNYFCPVITGFLSCNSISVNISQVTDFYAAGNIAVPKNAQGQLSTTNFVYCPGSANELMLAEAVYTSPSIVSLFVPAMAISNGSSFVRVTLSATAFVNENFTTTAAPPTGCAA